ncbi:glycosyltransferase [Candidatus Saccharibacteria bacterium]|nr:glycosyltransferase [Candidatus Saccharibacteria bacterium]
MKLEKLKVAIVCDWLTESAGGAEQVLLAVHEVFPKAPIYTSQYRPKRAVWFNKCDVRTGWVNIFPRQIRKFISPLRAVYFSHLDLSGYDLVISVANAEAKGVKTRGKHGQALHVSYLQGPPTQYYWGMYDEYLKNPGFGKFNWLARVGLKLLIGSLRKVDYKFAQKPDYLLANSNYVKDEIRKTYQRDAQVLFPPVESLQPSVSGKRHGFVTAGRQVSWKRVDLAIKACLKTGDDLLVIGNGPEHDKLVALARGHGNIEFLPAYNGSTAIAKHLSAAAGFIFPSLEPFGIVPVEALSTGTPVIAYGKGGALDYIQAGKNGILFDSQTVDSLTRALQKSRKIKFDYKAIAATARPFATTEFKHHLVDYLMGYLKNYDQKR